MRSSWLRITMWLKVEKGNRVGTVKSCAWNWLTLRLKFHYMLGFVRSMEYREINLVIRVAAYALYQLTMITQEVYTVCSGSSYARSHHLLIIIRCGTWKLTNWAPTHICEIKCSRLWGTLHSFRGVLCHVIVSRSLILSSRNLNQCDISLKYAGVH